MPFVNIKVLEGVSQDKKSELIAQVTEVISNVLQKKPDATYVVIDEVKTDNWGIGGQSITDRRKASA